MRVRRCGELKVYWVRLAAGLLPPRPLNGRAAPCTGVSELAATLVTLLVYCHQLQPLADSIGNQEDDIIWPFEMLRLQH